MRSSSEGVVNLLGQCQPPNREWRKAEQADTTCTATLQPPPSPNNTPSLSVVMKNWREERRHLIALVRAGCTNPTELIGCKQAPLQEDWLHHLPVLSGRSLVLGGLSTAALHQNLAAVLVVLLNHKHSKRRTLKG